jgi:hypothetical protein
MPEINDQLFDGGDEIGRDEDPGEQGASQDQTEDVHNS